MSLSRPTSQRGAALVTALMLTTLALVISLSLLYVVITGTRLSAGQKRYRTALAAARGGVSLMTEELIPRLFNSASAGDLETEFALVDLKVPQFDCLRQKIDHASDRWNLCTPAQVSADPEEYPDAVFRLKGGLDTTGFRVSSKIVDTVVGNTDQSGIDFLDTGGAASSKDDIVHPRHVPILYSIAVSGTRSGGPVREKAKLSLLYAY
ncbi:type IV pilus minor pilin PilX [Geomonas sp. Red276]